MHPNNNPNTAPLGRLLTEAEAAERLRCSKGKIQTLRLSGRLDYVRGRPVVIPERAIADYLEAERQRAAEKAAKRGRRELDPATWARVQVLLRKDRRKG